MKENYCWPGSSVSFSWEKCTELASEARTTRQRRCRTRLQRNRQPPPLHTYDQQSYTIKIVLISFLILFLRLRREKEGKKFSDSLDRVLRAITAMFCKKKSFRFCRQHCKESRFFRNWKDVSRVFKLCCTEAEFLHEESSKTVVKPA